MKVKDLIRHLQKYPKNLEVRFYKPPVRQNYTPIAPYTRDLKKNLWMYSANNVYIPMRPLMTPTKANLPTNRDLPKYMDISRQYRHLKEKREKEEKNEE